MQKTIKVRHDKGSYWLEDSYGLGGPFSAADIVAEVEKKLDTPGIIVMGPRHTLGKATDAVDYSRAPYVIYDLQGREVAEGYDLRRLWNKYFPRFLGWRMATSLERVWGPFIKVARQDLSDGLDDLEKFYREAIWKAAQQLQRSWGAWLKRLDRQLKPLGLVIHPRKSYVEGTRGETGQKLVGQIAFDVLPTRVVGVSPQDDLQDLGFYVNAEGGLWVWDFGM